MVHGKCEIEASTSEIGLSLRITWNGFLKVQMSTPLPRGSLIRQFWDGAQMLKFWVICPGNSDAHQSLKFTWWFGFFCPSKLSTCYHGSIFKPLFSNQIMVGPLWLSYISQPWPHQVICTVHVCWISTQWPQRMQNPLQGRKQMPTSVFWHDENKMQFLKIEEMGQFIVLFTCCHDFQTKIVLLNKDHLKW